MASSAAKKKTKSKKASKKKKKPPVKLLHPTRGFPICGAKAKSTGNPCLRAAGHGTDHLKVGKCKYHGGASKVKHGRNRKPEIRAHLALPYLKEARKLTMSDDADDARALRLSLIARELKKKKVISAEDAQIIAELCERSSRIDYRNQRVAQGRQALLTLEEVLRIFSQFMEALLSSGIIKPGSEKKVIALAADLRLVEHPDAN